MAWTDATNLWLTWVRDRADVFRRGYEQLVRLHGEPLAGRLLRFCDTGSALLAGGEIGDVRITGAGARGGGQDARITGSGR
ncbi:hypothetical protein [Streptomyces phaeochromogenes]